MHVHLKKALTLRKQLTGCQETFLLLVAKKNRNVIYKNKTCNIMDAAKKYKGNYCIGFTDKHGKKIQYKISYIPVKLCTFPQKDLVLAAVHGFGKIQCCCLQTWKYRKHPRRKNCVLLLQKFIL